MSVCPLVSVIIPTYNRADVLKRAIDSVLGQTYQNIEVIIVDDASTDKTEQMVAGLQNEKIRYIKNQVNKGPSGARNIGIKNALGSWIAFQDSDDYWYPEKIEKQLQIVNEEKDVKLVYCTYEMQKKGRRIIVPSPMVARNELHGDMLESLLKENKIGTPTMLVEKQVLDEVGGFREELCALEDWELALRIACKCRIGYVDEILVTAYHTVGGVNDYDMGTQKHLNSLCYIIQSFWAQTEKKEVFLSILQKIIGYAYKLGKENEQQVREALIPEIVSNEVVLDALLEERARAERFRDKYDMALGMIPEKRIRKGIRKVLKERCINAVSVYGYGYIGKHLVDVLEEEDISITCIIDKGMPECEHKVLRLDEIDVSVGTVIITVPDNDNIVENMLKKKNVKNIYHLSDLR